MRKLTSSSVASPSTPLGNSLSLHHPEVNPSAVWTFTQRSVRPFPPAICTWKSSFSHVSWRPTGMIATVREYGVWSERRGISVGSCSSTWRGARRSSSRSSSPSAARRCCCRFARGRAASAAGVAAPGDGWIFAHGPCGSSWLPASRLTFAGAPSRLPSLRELPLLSGRPVCRLTCTIFLLLPPPSGWSASLHGDSTTSTMPPPTRRRLTMVHAVTRAVLGQSQFYLRVQVRLYARERAERA